jgi:tetratricopeptide (TPR) repeat protein
METRGREMTETKRLGAARLAAGLGLWMGLGLVVAGVAAEQDAPTREEIRATMRQIFESVRTVLPLSVNDSTYADPRNRDRIQPALQSLAAHADVLARHGRRKDAGFGYLGRHLATDTRTILSSYESGEFEQSQFLLRQLTEYCVTCHSRLPSPNDSPVSEQFVDQGALAGLSLEERATLLIATRRFDEALSTLERLFASTSVHSANLLSPLTDYLVVSIRVKGDLARPLQTLETFSRRPDLWRNLRLDVEQWIADLRALGGDALAGADLASAKRLIEEAKGMINFPGDRSALVHYVVASSILHRYAEAHAQEKSRDLAEAYYYLGLVESRIGRDYWISQSGMFLESSIRLAPDELFAEKAYALLEEEIILGYSGSGGIHIPPDLEQSLHELQKLIDAP